MVAKKKYTYAFGNWHSTRDCGVVKHANCSSLDVRRENTFNLRDAQTLFDSRRSGNFPMLDL